MRRRLILVSIAVTSMVVIAFLVPLFILVADLARDSAVAEAERNAESLARVLSVLAVNGTLDEAVETVGEDRIEDVNGSIVLPNGGTAGLAVPPEEDISVAASGSSFVAQVDGGVAVYVPVLTGEGTAVVRVFTPTSALEEGVRRSWAILAALGIALIVIAAWVADRLGRSMVQPVNELAETANRLGDGDLSARVTPSGPPEIEDVGIEINQLAEQIGRLLQQERETAADLAHRLRTPLTAAKLSVEGLEEGPQKERLAADLDELERTTDFIIREARRPVRREEGRSCDLGAVAAERLHYWEPLASDQDRHVSADITSEPVPVLLPRADAEVMIDALIENVLSHTEDGTGLAVSVHVDDGRGVLAVEDGGPGFVDGSAIQRGSSRGQSTGLGLDIVRRTVEGSGGTLGLGESRSLGGAGVIVSLPIADRP
ncbi:MAG: HAMP domain-containing sensor histidine kinase [Acidimicrobiia bacterium]|nr:HAMP domain-containing sensor histidine kinase [Acidimicrobiia bacterium]